jgi:hypothetical protein
MTQAWHAGKTSGITPALRIRYYIDGESVASVDYPLFLAHAVGPHQTNGTNVGPDDKPGTEWSATGPWGNSLFGRTHDSGWYNNYVVPFQKSIKITLTDPEATSVFWCVRADGQCVCGHPQCCRVQTLFLFFPTKARLPCMLMFCGHAWPPKACIPALLRPVPRTHMFDQLLQFTERQDARRHALPD